MKESFTARIKHCRRRFLGKRLQAILVHFLLMGTVTIDTKQILFVFHTQEIHEDFRLREFQRRQQANLQKEFRNASELKNFLDCFI